MSHPEAGGRTPSDRSAVVAVDPGMSKCGLAAVDGNGMVLERKIVEADQVGIATAALAHQHGAATVVLGTRTGSPRAWELIHAAAPELTIAEIEEHMTSLEARKRYWVESPPGCLWSLVPAGLRFPPEPVDDWAAVILAERYLGAPDGDGDDG